MLEESRKRKECRKRKTLNLRHYFPCVVLSMSCLPLSARFLCEGTLLRACVIWIRCVLHPRKKVAYISTSIGECRERLIVLFVNRKKKVAYAYFFHFTLITTFHSIKLFWAFRNFIENSFQIDIRNNF